VLPAFFLGTDRMKRVCIFLDGENFRHSIVRLFEAFKKADYLPSQADWANLFQYMVRRAHPDGELVRVYWYVIELLDFFPYRFPKDSEMDQATPDSLGWFLRCDRSFGRGMQALPPEAFRTCLTKEVKRLKDAQDRMRTRFVGWRRVQDGIASRWPRIEFRRAGAIMYNAFTGKLGSEKAVDVKLATDLIMLREIYDIAVIVSGDQDYVPAVQVVKDSGKIVHNVVFRTRGGRLLPGGARRLNLLTDSCIEVSYGDLLVHLNIPGHSC